MSGGLRVSLPHGCSIPGIGEADGEKFFFYLEQLLQEW